MAAEYRAAKDKESRDELKIKQCGSRAPEHACTVYSCMQKAQSLPALRGASARSRCLARDASHSNIQARVQRPRRLAAQLARTEEAAKRALLRSDQGARGGVAAQLLDAQRQIAQLTADNSELSSKLAR